MLELIGEATVGYVIYRHKNEALEFHSIAASREAAEQDREILDDVMGGGWLVAVVPFLGWGKVIFGKNVPPDVQEQLQAAANTATKQ